MSEYHVILEDIPADDDDDLIRKALNFYKLGLDRTVSDYPEMSDLEVDMYKAEAERVENLSITIDKLGEIR